MAPYDLVERLVASKLSRRQLVTRTAKTGAPLALLAPLLGTAPRTSAASTQPGSCGQLIVGLVAEPVALDGAQVTDVNSARVIRRITESLIGFADEKAELVPLLAESWEISEDGREYTFKLRQGVKFHDGTPFNAEAVKFSLMRQIDEAHPANALGTYPFANFYFGSIESIEVVDDHTVKIIQKEPRASLPAALASAAAGIVSPTAVEQYGEDYPQQPVGTGPFKFNSWEPGVAVNLEANEDYWGEPTNLEAVIFRPFTEDQTRLAALQTGEVNLIVDLPPDNVEGLESDPNIDVLKQPGIHFWYVGLNTQKPPLDDARVRQALAYAIDKEAITRDVLRGTGEVAKSMLNPGTWGFAEDVPAYERDVEKAKQLLAEAGYPDGFEITMWVPESGSGMQSPVMMATVVQANLADIGVQANLETFEWGTFLNNLRTGDQEVFVNSWMAGLPDPDMTLYPFLHSSQWAPNGPNRFFYENSEVDRLLEEARMTSDQEERAELYRQVQKIALEEVPLIPVEHQIQTAAMASNVTNFELHPNFDLRLKDVCVE
jgi:peptide/nickel transport system substrate-binding protein